MIETDCITQIPFEKTGFFSKTMLDYLAKNEKINPFYNRFPDLTSFKAQIQDKKDSFSKDKREVLVNQLKEQYLNFSPSELTKNNIKLLSKENSFTIITGHQLNLFTGPLYFLYKIISVINLCETLSEAYPNENFIPVYWMATEDHDFEEINYFNYKNRKVKWNSNQTGAVGQFSTDGLEDVFEQFSSQIGSSRNATYLKNLFSEGYLKHQTLADATRYIANELFGKFGLVILDGDDKQLKSLFAPFVREELLQQTSFKEVSKTNSQLEKDYKVQVNPREINLFYLVDNLRERIFLEEGVYRVNNTEITFSETEILKELEQNPERFSPNVIMRPLYQEVILPNLCYVGGGGEMAYWLQLKDYFNKVNIPFPILLLRNSVQVISDKDFKKLKSLNISSEEIFFKQNDLLANKVKENSDISFSFKDQKAFLQEQFNSLKVVAERTDKSFLGAVNAQEKKQLNGLDNLEKRLLRAEKRKHKDLVERITEIQNKLLPNQSLEERQRNFSEYYLEYGDEFIQQLKENLKPLDLAFTVIKV